MNGLDNHSFDIANFFVSVEMRSPVIMWISCMPTGLQGTISDAKLNFLYFPIIKKRLKFY